MKLFRLGEWLLKMLLSCVLPLPSVFMMTLLCFSITLAPQGWLPSGNTTDWSWPNCFINYFIDDKGKFHVSVDDSVKVLGLQKRIKREGFKSLDAFLNNHGKCMQNYMFCQKI